MKKLHTIKVYKFLENLLKSELLDLDLTKEAEELKKILETAYISKKSGLSIEEMNFAIELYKKEHSIKKVAMILGKPKTTVYDSVRNNMTTEEYLKYSKSNVKKEKDVKLNDLKSKWLHTKN